jgi:hypothetical protein
VTAIEALNQFPKMAGAVVILSLTIVLGWKFVQGLFDSRQFFSGLAVVAALLFGWVICQEVFGYLRGTSPTRDVTELSCRSVHHYFECNGWPLFTEGTANFARAAYRALHPIFNVPLVVAQVTGAFYLYTRLARGVWFGPREIGGAFFAGAIVFLSLARLPELTSLFLKATSGILSLRDVGGGSTDALSEAHDVLKAWKDFLLNWDIANAEKRWWDVSKWMGFATSGFVSTIIDTPLTFLSIVSLVYLFFQQLTLAGIPLVVFMNSVQLKDDPLIVFRLVFKVGLYGVAQHMMWWMLSWIPKPPEFLNTMVTDHTTIFNLTLGGPATGFLTVMMMISVTVGFLMLPFLMIQTLREMSELRRSA